MDQSIIDELIETAKKKNVLDDYNTDWKTSDGDLFIPYDHFGGNMDDAFWGGIESGEIQAARDLLDKMGIAWK